jgi:hypothetical protein
MEGQQPAQGGPGSFLCSEPWLPWAWLRETLNQLHTQKIQSGLKKGVLVFTRALPLWSPGVTSWELQAVSLRGFSLKEFLSMLLSSGRAHTAWVEKARVFLQPSQADDGFLDFCMVQWVWGEDGSLWTQPPF